MSPQAQADFLAQSSTRSGRPSALGLIREPGRSSLASLHGDSALARHFDFATVTDRLRERRDPPRRAACRANGSANGAWFPDLRPDNIAYALKMHWC